MKWPLVLVEWKDHVSNTTWTTAEEMVKKPALCLTVGWLMYEDEEGLTVVSCIDPYNPEGQIGGTQYILKNCITAQKVIRKGKP
jgi:hypothetical protein